MLGGEGSTCCASLWQRRWGRTGTGQDRNGAALLLVPVTSCFFPGDRAALGGPGRAAAGPSAACWIGAPPAAPHPADGHEGVSGNPAAVPALGKSVSRLGRLGPLPTPPALSLPQANSRGLLLACRGGEHSGAGSALRQDVGHGWKHPAGIPVPNPITSPHHHVFSLSPSLSQRRCWGPWRAGGCSLWGAGA